jgi:thiamine transporter
MRSQRVLTLVEIALTIALSAVLSVLAVRMPWNVAGGTVSFAMLPILVLSLRRGVIPGVIAGLGFGIIDYMIEPYFLAYAQVFLDYGVAFAAVGVAGLGAPTYRWALKSSSKQAFADSLSWIPIPGVARLGGMWLTLVVSIPWILVGGAGRFAAAWLSGVVFFGANAPAGQPVWIYSAIYNLSYIVPSIVLCVVGASLVLPALELAVPTLGRSVAQQS